MQGYNSEEFLLQRLGHEEKSTIKIDRRKVLRLTNTGKLLAPPERIRDYTLQTEETLLTENKSK